MQLRSGRTTLVTPPPRLGDGDGNDMNAALWGELQNFFDLSLIYAKLPLGPFFRLRQVCKEWNRLASDRQFLEHHFKPPMSNLYFVVARSAGHRLWTFQDSSWTSSPVPRRRCEVSGLLYEDSNCQRVFDLHTRVVYFLPPLPSGRLTIDVGAIVGMTVDTTLVPYGFRIFLLEDCTTSIYDSNSGAWTTPTTSCVLMRMRMWDKPLTFSSVLYNKVLYMLTLRHGARGCHVYTYDLEKHHWSGALFGVPRFNRLEWGGVGVWQDRWFACGKKHEWDFGVWGMNTNLHNPWTEFDCMPKDLCEWMMRGLEHQNVRSTFCGEHVLVYGLKAKGRAVLYNLDRKTWAKIALQENYRFQKRALKLLQN